MDYPATFSIFFLYKLGTQPRARHNGYARCLQIAKFSNVRVYIRYACNSFKRNSFILWTHFGDKKCWAKVLYVTSSLSHAEHYQILAPIT